MTLGNCIHVFRPYFGPHQYSVNSTYVCTYYVYIHDVNISTGYAASTTEILSLEDIEWVY